MKDCVSLEIAKKLKEAGWKQPTAFRYRGYATGWHLAPPANDKGVDPIAAPTIGELLEALPKYIYLSNGDNGWMAEHDGIAYPSSSNPADALALLWMALKENGII